MSSFTSVALGSQRLAHAAAPVGLEVVTREGQRYLRMTSMDRLTPFFMNVVSDGDGWLFASSQGALAAGRVDPDRALFPYQTVDKILARPDSAGPLSVFLVEQRGGWQLWEPWQASGSAYRLERVLLKHVAGTELIFEETNLDLGLRFQKLFLDLRVQFGRRHRDGVAALEAFVQGLGDLHGGTSFLS